MIKLRGDTKSNKTKVQIPINKYNGGVNKQLSESRIRLNEAKEAINLMQVEDGLWKTRWGTDYYGADHGETLDGACEYMKDDATTELITIADGKAWSSSNGGSVTEVTGATFTAGTQCYFMQIGGYLYIANGTDPLARYDGSVLTKYTAMSAPTSVTATRTGLSSGSYNMYCEATAVNAIGETVGSTEASVTLNRVRDVWTASDSIEWTCSAVVGATAYQWYISEVSGQEALVGSSEGTSFVDDGSKTINPYIVPPLGNTTAGPKFKSMAMSGNRIWATNDDDSMYKVYFSGTGTNIGNFSDFYGGGWINLEKGGREIPVAVKHYQSGGGEGRATVLCKTPEGQGAVWQIQISSATVGDVSFSIPSAVKVVGSSGTDSILGVVATNKDIMFPNKRGWFSLGFEKDFYNILRTNEISSRIRPYWRNLIGSQVPNTSAYFKDAKIFISITTTGTNNNRMIIYDLERMNWTVDWTIGAKQFLEYTETDGTTKFLYTPVSGNKLIELSEDIAGDLGTGFSTSYISGRWSLSKLFKDFVKVDKVYIKLGSPRGAITLEVSGAERNSGFSSLASKTISPQYSLTGMGYDLMGSIQMGDTAGVPTFFSDAADQRNIKIRKKLRDIQFRITTDSIDSEYTLLGLIVEGNKLRINPPSSEKL